MKKKDRDYGKYRFNGKTYSKGQLVLAVISFYMNENPKTTASQLKTIFPRNLQNRFDVVAPVKIAAEKSIPVKRYFLRKEELIKTANGFWFSVTKYWGSSNIQPFIDYVKGDLGYRITRTSS